MDVDRRNKQIGIVGPLVIDLEVDHDLVLGLLQLHHLAEFVGLARFAFADDLRRGLKHAQKLNLRARIAAIDPSPGLFHDLLYPGHRLVDLVAQAIELQLPHGSVGLLYPGGDLRRELLCLSDHAAGRVEQLAVSKLEVLRPLLRPRAGSPRNVEPPQLHAPTAVAQLGADGAGNFGDLLHGANEHAHPIPQKARVGRIVDIGLYHGGIAAHPPTFHNPLTLSDFYNPLVSLLDDLGPHRQPPAANGLGIQHLAAADAGKVAIDKVAAHFALENLIAPVADMLKNE